MTELNSKSGSMEIAMETNRKQTPNAIPQDAWVHLHPDMHVIVDEFPARPRKPRINWLVCTVWVTVILAAAAMWAGIIWGLVGVLTL